MRPSASKAFGACLLCAALLMAPWLEAGIQPAHNVPLMEQSATTVTAQAQSATVTAALKADEKRNAQNGLNILVGGAVTLLLGYLVLHFTPRLY